MTISRQYVKDFHLKQFSRLEGSVRRKSSDHFRQVARETAEAVRRLDWNPDPRSAKPQAAGVMARVFDFEQWHEELLAIMGPALTEVFAEGALIEIRINKAVKQLGAPDIEAFFARALPQWLIDRGKQALRTIFSQDYWLRIHETTRSDIQLTLEEGISRGWTTREIATDISFRHGRQYSLRRGFAVARTETGSALNAGHQAGIEQLSEETGFDMRAEWLSVLGSTTRPSHAALDGVQADDEGMFNLNGILVPYPSHHNLPASDRVNCQCTVLSSVAAEELV